jgi:predicted AAA+ superfamily ATPase
MAVSNRERVGTCLDLLQGALRTFVVRELKAKYPAEWMAKARATLPPNAHDELRSGDEGTWDVAALISIIIGNWQYCFNRTLDRAERTYIHEIQAVRNDWAHQKPFSLDDTNRAIDTIKRLLEAVGAPEAEAVDAQMQEVLRQKFDDLRRRESKGAVAVGIAGEARAGLKPWREVVEPHPDVARGEFVQAEFAADIDRVVHGKASPEYQDPKQFFGRTYITSGLHFALVNALRRISGNGGEPVLDLMTSFGGGKTHTMIALYHLFGSTPAAQLPGVEKLLEEAGVKSVPRTRRAVLVGTHITPSVPRKTNEGIEIRTLWGEMAYQLGGPEGYAIVAEADRTGTIGADLLQQLFRKYSPCLVLIDEWVAHARQLYDVPTPLPAGSFASNMTFAQGLTAAAAEAGVHLVVTLPQSDTEMAGSAGRAAFAELSKVIHRSDSPWRPTTELEGYEIVRRRLFQPIPAADRPAMDAVCRAFSELYASGKADFPPECREAEYERRMQACYPIHPELLERLYKDWSTMDRFQKTRGMLRLMATVIHSLWERNDAGLMILPAHVPIDDAPVANELTKYPEDPWMPVISRDIDGPTSTSLQIDRDAPNLGRLSATRRVARTLFMGTAPMYRAATKGIDERRINLGCAQPGEQVPLFANALKKLGDRSVYLYQDGSRYWFGTQPSVLRLAEDRAAQVGAEQVEDELIERLRAEQGARAEFARIYPAPQSSADVPDERETRLVLLHPRDAHSQTDGDDGGAVMAALGILRTRGSQPRKYQNSLVFIAGDRNRLAELQSAIRQFLAWRSIKNDREKLNLDAHQSSQVDTKLQQADDGVRAKIPEAYSWLLVPAQPEPKDPIRIEAKRMQAGDRLAARAAKRMLQDATLATTYGAPNLRLDLDRVPIWRDGRVEVKALFELYAQYVYLQRLTDPTVLRTTISNGVSSMTWTQDGFAFADTFDQAKSRFGGLVVRQLVDVGVEGRGFLVAPSVATPQLEVESAPRSPEGTPDKGGQPTPGSAQPADTRVAKKTRFYGRVRPNVNKLGSSVGQVAQDIVAHLQLLEDADIEVTLEIRATAPSGIDAKTARIVNTNASALKFDVAEME